MRKLPLICLLVSALAAETSHAQYSNAVQALSPIGYWPLNETQNPGVFIATNSGTLGAIANGYYSDPLFVGGSGYIHKTLYTGTVTGVTSDGDAAAGFDGGANANGNDGYLVIPQVNGNLSPGKAFTAEVWAMPGGGDPNDTSGTSYASTEWAALLTVGGGGAFYTEAGDSSGNTYGYTISMAGIYAVGYPNGWYGGVPYTDPLQLQTNAMWIVDFYNGGTGNTPSMEFDVPFFEPTPQWFHLVLTYDGTNANFYTNGVLAATTVTGSPLSTNTAFAPNRGAFPSTPTGAYAFTLNNGVGYAPDKLNPLCIGDINQTYSFVNQGYPQPNAIGFNCQIFNGSVDEAAVYTNVLSASTVTKHYTDAKAANTTLYTNDVFSANPLVYLRFDEPASNFVEPDDSVRPVSTNYGTLGSTGNGLYEPGSVPATAGPAGSGLGSPSYGVQMTSVGCIDVGAAALSGTALDPTGNTPFSASLWFRANPADIFGRFQTIAGRGDHSWRFSIDNGGHARWNPGANPELSSVQNLNDGQWHQLVGTTDGTNVILYVDGIISKTGGGAGSLTGTPFDLIIGGAPDYMTSSPTRRLFDGQVSQVAFFGTTLTSNQVQALYGAAGVYPFITQQPVATEIIGAGSSGSLSVVAGGNPPLSYQWYLGANPVSNAAGNISGATSSTLTISNAIVANGGNYTVKVSNTSGSVTSSVAVVTINSAPIILTQPSPASSTVYVGNQVVYPFTATGASPLSYQLYKGSTPISGATSSNFVVTAVAGTNSYYLVVSNAVNPPATSSVVTISAQTFVAPAGNFVVNFAACPNGTATQVYVGQGAFNDPGNNIWNPIVTSGLTTVLGTNSAGGSTLVTANLIFGFNNGANGSVTAGTPSYLVSYEDAVNSGAPGIGTMTTPTGQLKINDLPQGTYSLYLYGANYDGDRGSIFAVASVNGGVADGGITSTQNGSVNGTSAIVNGKCTFAEGDNYVLFNNVVPDPTGAITVTYVPDTNAISANTGEAPFNAVQVVRSSVSAPTLTIQPGTGSVILTWSPTSSVLTSSTNAAGPYLPVAGATSPYTNSTSQKQLFFRVHTP